MPMKMSPSSIERLFRRYADRRDPNDLEQLMKQHRSLAVGLAKRYFGRGVDEDELVQIAMIGLHKAVVRFDPRRGYQFATFATPTITGELKRHFRDHSHMIKVPRDIWELGVKINRLNRAALEQTGRGLSVEELTQRLEADPSSIEEALVSNNAQAPFPFSQPLGDDGVLEDTLQADFNLAAEVVQRLDLERALARLQARERLVLLLSCREGLSQQEIGSYLGVSQMQVSRILRVAALRIQQQLSRDGGREARLPPQLQQVLIALRLLGGELRSPSGGAGTELAQSVGVSTSVMSERLQRLEMFGLIRRVQQGNRTFLIAVIASGGERLREAA